MNCLLEDKCWDARSEKCGTCMHNKERSYYVAYREYPADKWPIDPRIIGEIDYGPYSPCYHSVVGSPVKYPSPTSTEWPYLPSGDDLRTTWQSYIIGP